MRRCLLLVISVASLLLATGFEATAQYRFGGGGFRAGGFHGYGIGIRPGIRPAFGPGWRGGGWGWRGAGFYPRRPYWGGGYYPYRRYWGGGGYPYWGIGSGLAAAATVGALAAYPAYPAYAYPAYPAYPAYEVVPPAEGGQCSTPVRICTLYAPAPLGTGCSCRVPGGRARGAVVGF